MTNFLNYGEKKAGELSRNERKAGFVKFEKMCYTDYAYVMSVRQTGYRRAYIEIGAIECIK